MVYMQLAPKCQSFTCGQRNGSTYLTGVLMVKLGVGAYILALQYVRGTTYRADWEWLAVRGRLL